MTEIETQARNKFAKNIEILEKQNKDLKNIFRNINHHFDYNVCLPLSAVSIISTYSIDIIKKQDTILELTLDGKYSEASIILRNLMEDIVLIIKLAKNPLQYRDLVIQKSIDEKDAQGIIDADTPQTIFNKNKKQLFEDAGEEDLYPLYRTLSVSETHTGVQAMRDNVRIKRNNMSLNLEREFDKRRTASLLYASFIIVDKLYKKAISYTIYYKTHSNGTKKAYESRRDNYYQLMNQLYSNQNLGSLIDN